MWGWGALATLLFILFSFNVTLRLISKSNLLLAFAARRWLNWQHRTLTTTTDQRRQTVWIVLNRGNSTSIPSIVLHTMHRSYYTSHMHGSSHLFFFFYFRHFNRTQNVLIDHFLRLFSIQLRRAKAALCTLIDVTFIPLQFLWPFFLRSTTSF